MTGQENTGQLETKNIGLRGIVVADSTISKVDGEKGILIYRGFDIAALAREGTFEEVIHLLLEGELPTAGELEALRRELAECRFLPEAVLDALRTLPKEAVPMDVLQASSTAACHARSGTGDSNPGGLSSPGLQSDLPAASHGLCLGTYTHRPAGGGGQSRPGPCRQFSLYPARRGPG